MRGALFPVLALLVLPLAAGAGLTAGDVDDHLNWDAYLRYLERTGGGQGGQGQSGLPSLILSDRITLRVVDENGAAVAFARVEVEDALSHSVVRWAGSDGLVRLFPARDGLLGNLSAVASSPGGEPADAVSIAPSLLGSNRTVELEVEGPSAPGERLDIMFVIDATGSMGDEMAYITAELDAIVAQAVAEHGNADLRLGLVVYRDGGDDYVVRNLGFTDSLDTMRSWLAAQRADGGGDMPEAMDKGLAAGVDAQWRGGATTRLLFLVADAPPHPEGYAPFLSAVERAQDKGIHIYPLGASGVESNAQYLLRAAAALTQGRYLFLTDDSGIGNSHAEPDIPCYVVTELKDLMARVIDGEMAGRRIEPDGQEVVRQVGNYRLGVCLADPVPEGQDDEPADPVDGEGATGATGSSTGTGMYHSEAGAPASGDSAARGLGASGTAGGSGDMAYDSAGGSAEGSAEGDGAPVDEGSHDDSASTPGPGLALLALALLAGVGWRRLRPQR